MTRRELRRAEYEAIKSIKSIKQYVFIQEWNDALNIAIDALEKQIPKKPYNDNDNGVYEKEYCPTCHRSLFPNDSHCKCGQAINWSESE